MAYRADDLAGEWPQTQFINNDPTVTFSNQGEWYLVRPIPPSFIDRIGDALGVLTGRFDAVRWQNQ